MKLLEFIYDTIQKLKNVWNFIFENRKNETQAKITAPYIKMQSLTTKEKASTPIKENINSKNNLTTIKMKNKKNDFQNKYNSNNNLANIDEDDFASCLSSTCLKTIYANEINNAKKTLNSINKIVKDFESTIIHELPLIKLEQRKRNLEITDLKKRVIKSNYRIKFSKYNNNTQAN